MHRHFVSQEIILQKRIELSRADSRHFVNVLRLRKDDVVELFDGAGTTARCKISDSSRGAVTLVRDGDVVSHPMPKCRLTLGACISKGKRMDWTIEKAVELGATAIVPIISDFSVVRVEKDDEGDKRERWHRVAIDAARQCGTAFVPEIMSPTSFTQAIRAILAANDKVFTAALQPDAVPLRNALAAARTEPHPPSAVAWLIGPEGDFSETEYQNLRDAGTIFVSLGDLVLRTETAAVYGLCVLGAEWL